MPLRVRSDTGRVIFLCGIILSGTVGCSRSAGPVRTVVSGEVIFDGEPLESGRIQFCPTDGTQGPAAVATVTYGFYEFDRSTGPVVGKNRVRIESSSSPGFELDNEQDYARSVRQNKGNPVLPRERIPAEYNERSELIVQVDMDGNSKHDFLLEKSTRRAR